MADQEAARYVSWANKMILSVSFYSTLITMPIEILANLFMLVVFLRKKFKINTIGLYHQIWSITNVLVLIVSFLTYYPYSIGKDLTLMSDFTCKLLPYLVRVGVQLSSWIQVFITFDRYFIVAYPNKFRFIKTKTFVALIYLALLLILFLINVPNLFFSLSITTTNTTTTILNGTNLTSQTTSISCSALRHVSLMRDMVAVVFRTIIPLILIILGNGLLIKAFIASKMRVYNGQSHHSHSVEASRSNNPSLRIDINQTRSNVKSEISNRDLSLASAANTSTARKSSKSTPPSYHKNKKDTHFMKSIIAMDTVFILSFIPLAATLILTNIYAYIPSIGSSGNVAANRLAYFISIFIAFIAYVCPFLLSLIFNKHFRNEFFLLLSEIKSKII